MPIRQLAVLRSIKSYLLLLLPLVLPAQSRLERYALVLADPPVAAVARAKPGERNLAVESQRQRIAAAQQGLRQNLAAVRVPVTGSVDTLVNAVFVQARPEDKQLLEQLPGVAWVAPLRKGRLHMNRAIDLINAPAAWNLFGGEGRAGAGMRIGIIDTGIDHTHPAFQDETLTVPSGFPRCTGDNCQFTNRKIIVARSYVAGLVGSDPRFSRPDDLSPRDRVGHGTAAASVAAGVRVQGPAATVVGVAPKAFLGNYKVFGSPGVIDGTFEDVVLQAMQDAFNDGMDVVSLSLGFTAQFGPYDTCGAQRVRCDLMAAAVETAVRNGLVVVVSAGNTGDIGQREPTLGSIESPGTVTEAITVGASTNSHEFFNSVRFGADAPANLQRVNALFGNGPKPGAPYSAPLRDVSRLGNDGLACTPLGNGTLTGAIALIRRGGCERTVKVSNAQQAGAIGVILYQMAGVDTVFRPRDLEGTGIPLVLVGNTAGEAMRRYVEGRQDAPVTLDPGLTEQDTQPDNLAPFSSFGPTIGELTIKPDLVAPGTDVYMATQNFDPNGDLFDATRFINAQGTSFAAPMVAGAAALVLARWDSLTPPLSPEEVKSTLVGTANADVFDFDNQGRFRANLVGAGNGKLNAAAAVSTNIVTVPASLSFRTPQQAGVIPSQRLRIINLSNTPATVALSVVPRGGLTQGIQLSRGTITLNARSEASVDVLVTPSLQPGWYEGYIELRNGATSTYVPYLYIVPSGVLYDVYAIQGGSFLGVAGERLPLPAGTVTLKAVDRFGVPLVNQRVQWRIVQGGGRLNGTAFDSTTDAVGAAGAQFILGSTIGPQVFAADIGGQTVTFSGRSIAAPTIASEGIVNAASGQRGPGIAPGSYISIYGSALSEATRFLSTPYLPLALSNVSVSFDTDCTNNTCRRQFPGRLSFVSPGQVNVQVPWELAGASSVRVKVSYDLFSTAVIEVPVAPSAPAAFEYTEPSTNRMLTAALDSSFRLITSDNRARRGQSIQIYANGLGPVTNTPATGELTPASPLPVATSNASVTIGGRPANVQFTGMSPTAIGLYQINLVVPNDTPTGYQPVIISIGGQTAKTVTIPVE